VSRVQKGRKPRKNWHRREAARRWIADADRWPQLGVTAAPDGQPSPLRQGQSGFTDGKKLHA
jgi:hypothetical protein